MDRMGERKREWKRDWRNMKDEGVGVRGLREEGGRMREGQ